MRVRAHHFQLRDNEYVPFIETDAADAYAKLRSSPSLGRRKRSSPRRSAKSCSPARAARARR